MGKLKYRDDLFDDPAYDWVHSHTDEHFRQRHLRQEGAIYCETLMTAHGTTDVAAAIGLICGPWDWWEHGQIADFVANGDGSSDQILSPVWWFITRVGLHIFPPLDLPELKGRRVPLLLTEDFMGPSSMDVYPAESGEATMVRGRFHGVEYQVPAIPNKWAEWLHLDAESGTMPAPFPKGTGWVGLLHKLEMFSSGPQTGSGGISTTIGQW